MYYYRKQVDEFCNDFYTLHRLNGEKFCTLKGDAALHFSYEVFDIQEDFEYPYKGFKSAGEAISFLISSYDNADLVPA